MDYGMTFLVLRKARRLAYRTTWRGLKVSVEQAPGEAREWYDPHSTVSGRTVLGLPYGYLRGTLGTDGDQVDVFLGPDEGADTVYIVTQMKPPAFTERDEQKGMLGFHRWEDAKDAYLRHYDDPRFFGGMTAMPFAEFRDKVLASRRRPGFIGAE